MTTFTAILISLFISLGIIGSEAELENLSAEQQEQINLIIIDDDLG